MQNQKPVNTTPKEIPDISNNKQAQKPRVVTLNQIQDEIAQLENDLKYVTGAANRKEIEDRLQKLREEAQGSKEAEIINRAHDDNYEQKMSFNFAQKMAIKAVHDVMLNLPLGPIPLSSASNKVLQCRDEYLLTQSP